MAAVQLVRCTAPSLLLDYAVEGVFPSARSDEQPWPTLHCWIILRQGGMRDDVHRLAARRGVPGWFDSPICLMRDLPERWGNTNGKRSLSEPERHALLATLLEQHSARFFRGAASAVWVPALDRLLGELVSESIDVEEFAVALERSASDEFERDRATMLSVLYRTWCDTIARLGRVDGRDAMARLAAEIVDHPARFPGRLGGRRSVRIVGLADLRGGWRQLLRAMATSSALDEIRIFTSARLDLSEELAATEVVPEQRASFARALFSDDSAPVSDVRLLEAPDAEREIEIVAARVRALLDRGTDPSSVAVVARQARPLVEQFAKAFATVGVPITARRRTSLAHTGPAHALRAMLAAASGGWTRHGLVELAENPLLATGLERDVLNYIGYAAPVRGLSAWSSAIEKLHGRCLERDASERPRAHARGLPNTDAVSRTLAGWNVSKPALEFMDRSHTAAEWLEWVIRTCRSTLRTRDDAVAEHAVAEHARAEHAGTEGAVSLSAQWSRLSKQCDDTDALACERIAELASEWRDALIAFGGDGTPGGATQFNDRLRVLLEQDLITQPETDFGVVVSESLAAAWRPFDHVFLVGLSSGEFPARKAGDGVLSDAERVKLVRNGLGLDSADAWRERERELFRVLCAAPRRSLTLSWPVRNFEGSEVARSSFADEAVYTLARSITGRFDAGDAELVQAGVLDRVPSEQQLTPGYPVVPDPESAARAREIAARESQRSLECSLYNGEISDAGLQAWLAERYDESFVWSATQLEQAAVCRWHWFAARLLKLAEPAGAGDFIEPSVRGTMMHRTLNRFFANARERFGKPTYLTEPDTVWIEELLRDALEHEWSIAHEEELWLGAQSMRDVTRAELLTSLLRYLTWEVAWNSKSRSNLTSAGKQIRTGVFDGEISFDEVISAGDVRIRLRGSIDRLDRGVDERIEGAAGYMAAIDYKSTPYSTPASGKATGWEDGVVLQLPLYAAVLRKLFPHDRLARIEYRSIRPPDVVHSLSFVPLRKGLVQSAPDSEEKLTRALSAAGELVKEIRAGRLRASPAPSCCCPSYCPGRDICRIPGGPVEPRGRP